VYPLLVSTAMYTRNPVVVAMNTSTASTAPGSSRYQASVCGSATL
jgi:hypothetical protein